jgi:hypothetical protein
MIRLRPIQQQHCSLSRWTFTAKRACVVITDYEPERLAPLPPPAALGVRGVCAVAARCCADTIERSLACQRAHVRAPASCALASKPDRRWAARRRAITTGGFIRNRVLTLLRRPSGGVRRSQGAAMHPAPPPPGHSGRPACYPTNGTPFLQRAANRADCRMRSHWGAMASRASAERLRSPPRLPISAAEDGSP